MLNCKCDMGFHVVLRKYIEHVEAIRPPDALQRNETTQAPRVRRARVLPPWLHAVFTGRMKARIYL